MDTEEDLDLDVDTALKNKAVDKALKNKAVDKALKNKAVDDVVGVSSLLC